MSVRGRHVRPDIVFTRSRVAVFVDGCFWHGCPDHGEIPVANREFWASKIAATRDRDRRQTTALTHAGWTVVRVWEHEPPEEALARVVAAVRSSTGVGGTSDVAAGSGS
jgi:DNA mismatch endonuclease (patch repair protein)